MGLNLNILKNASCVICIPLYTESVAGHIDHFADVFVRENVAYGYDVVATLWYSKAYSRCSFVVRNPA